MKIKWGKLIFCLTLPLAVGALSAWITRDAMKGFSSLKQPPLSPPGWLFPMVWTALYLLMGFALYRVWVSDAISRDKRTFAALFALSLFFNFFWSPIFFNRQAFTLAFIWLVVLWVLILGMVYVAHRVDKVAFWCLLPYLVWVSFAGYLNLGVALLN